jgi:hypothetical protein
MLDLVEKLIKNDGSHSLRPPVIITGGEGGGLTVIEVGATAAATARALFIDGVMVSRDKFLTRLRSPPLFI